MQRWLKYFKLTETNWLVDLSVWSILLMPLILYADINQPFSFGRYVIFMFALVSLLLGLISVGKIQLKYAWWRHPIFWITLIWLAIAIVSACLGVNSFRSWWGTVSRSTGMFFYIGLWLASWLMLLAINSKEQWIKIFSIMSWVGGISALYALLQQLNIPFVVVIISGGSRASALMGNPIFLGQLLLFTIFLTLYFLLVSTGKAKWYYLISLILQIIVIFLTASRGPLLALAVAGIIWAVGLWLVYRPRLREQKNRIIGVVAGMGVVGALLIWLMPRENLTRIVDIYSSSIQSRIITWQTAWSAIQEKPFLGYGNENAWYALTHHYQPGLAGINFGETIVDRAHNFILDQLITNGWLGLFVLLILISCLIWVLTKSFRKYLLQGEKEKAILLWSLLAIVVSYFVANLTAFETVTTAIYGAVVLVGIICLTSFKLPSMVKISYQLMWRFIIGLVLISLLLFDFKFLLPAWRIGKYVDVANDAYRKNDYLQAARAYVRAQEFINPYKLSFLINYPGFARKYSILLLESNLGASTAIAEDGLRIATNIKKQEPDRVAIFMEIPILFTVLSYANPIYEVNAQESFEKLVKEFPHHEYVYLNWSRALMGVGKYKEARQILNQLADNFEITPTSFEFWRALVDIRLNSSNHKYIIADLQTAIIRETNFIEGDQDVLKYIVAYLVSRKQWQLAEYYQEKIVLLSPKDIDEHINLSAIYKELGEYEKAAEQARIVVQLDSSKTELTQQFLESIGQTL